MDLDPAERPRMLVWLAAQLEPYGLRPRLVGPAEAPVLRIRGPRTGRVRFIACVPTPRASTWAWVWPRGWALVTDPHAVARIVKELS